MIRILTITFALIAFLATPSFAQEDGSEDQAGLVHVQRVVSPGGIEAWLVQDDFVPIVSIRVGFFGGASLEEPGKAGAAQLTSWTLDEGAGDMDSRAFRNRLEDHAIRMGFSAGRDRFYASMTTLTENQDVAFDMFRLALNEPRFDDDAVERMRRQLLSGIAQAERDPNSIAANTWWAAAFPDTSYGRSVAGTAESVAALTADDLRAFHATLNRRDMRIGVAGDIGPEALGRLLDRTFLGLPATGPDYAPVDTAPAGGGETIVVEHPNAQSVVIFGSQGIDYADPDYMAAMVMNAILGGGNFSNRLVNVVREQNGLAYYVSSGLSVLDGASIFQGSVGTENARVARSLDLIRAEIARMRDDGVTAQELEDTQRYLTGAFALGFDSNSSIASRLAFYQLEDLGIDYINTRNARVNEVTQEDVVRVARRLLDPDNLLVVVVGQPEGLGDEEDMEDQPEAAE